METFVSFLAAPGISARKEALLLMQSSAAVAGRALIMLVCVVGIPAWALSGSSWSDMAKKLQDFRWPAILNPASASTSSSPNDAPRFAQSRVTGGPATARESAPLAQIVVNPTRMPESAATSTQPPAPAPSDVVPVGYQTSAPTELAAIPQSSGNAGDASLLTADQFRSIPERLRQLGATYYLLESWGSDQQMYRFYCKMAVGGCADYTRYFEASHSDPLHAMQQVLQQVEAWRSGGRIEDVGLRN